MSTSVRDQFQQTAMDVHELGDIDRAITTGVRRRNRTFAAATAVGVAGVVVLAALTFNNPLKGATPEPLQPPTPTPSVDAIVYGWPSTTHNAPGVYSLDNMMCAGTFCNAGFMHNGYGSSDVDILIEVDPGSATSQAPAGTEPLDDGTPVVVAGYDGIYRRVGHRSEQWSVSIEGHLLVIDLRAKPGTSRADLAEAHAIIDSMRTAPTDNVLNELGQQLVFTLTSNDWDSG